MAAACQGQCMNDGEPSCACVARMVTLSDAECAPIQSVRRAWKPVLPSQLLTPVVTAEGDKSVGASPADAEALAKLFPNTWGKKFVTLKASDKTSFDNHEALRIGVVLSGGQAAGGHNVIAGIYDYVMQCNGNSKLYGFKSGPHGIFTHNYIELTADIINKYRNMGGFDMICSGRHKIENDEQKKASMEICQKLDLHGLIIIGGDDSNTNGAVLAEYFKANNCKTLVAGAPKTIDGDLKNEYIEISFGFDTAVKVYSELVGNLCIDAKSNKDRYHFVRLMGRSASNITLETALQTRPNLCFIGEEVQAQNRTLISICQEIADMVQKRHALGKDYGVVLVPEGLIEFIPEVGLLISEINDILGETTGAEGGAGGSGFKVEKLTPKSQAVFNFLPESIRGELLLERDSHGNVQVSKIATERLLILMTQQELAKRNHKGRFVPLHHFFGYEGRCAMPSNFDANYCYALGHTAGALIDNGLTGYMAVLKNLHKPTSQWQPAGCPITMMMNLERRKGKEVPVIKKYLVELDKKCFTSFVAVREQLKTDDVYRNPGPIQFEGPSSDVANFMICPPAKPECLVKTSGTAGGECCCSQTGAGENNCLSASTIVEERLSAKTELPQSLADAKLGALKPCAAADGYEVDPAVQAVDVAGKKIGVVCVGPSAPGATNALGAICSRLCASKCQVVVYDGVKGLVENKPSTEPCCSSSTSASLGGFPFSDCTSSTTITPSNGTAVAEACKRHDSMIFFGDSRAFEALSALKIPNAVFVPMSCDNSMTSSDVSVDFGFDTVSKTYASLVGNLLTDAASAHKYWYFVKTLGGSGLALEIAGQTHVNHCVIPEEHQTVDTIVKEIADLVFAKGNEGKNFGCVLIPESTLTLVQPFKSALLEAGAATTSLPEDYPAYMKDAFKPQQGASSSSTTSSSSSTSSVELCDIPIEVFLSQLVDAELKKRAAGTWKGSYAPVTYYLGLQARSAIPSKFDCSLAACHGHLAAMAASLIATTTSGTTSATTPLSSMLLTEVSKTASNSRDHWLLKVVPAERFGKAMKPSHQLLLQSWNSNKALYASKELYCNPGPIQFAGPFSRMVNRTAIAHMMPSSNAPRTEISKNAHTTDISDSVVTV